MDITPTQDDIYLLVLSRGHHVFYDKQLTEKGKYLCFLSNIQYIKISPYTKLIIHLAEYPPAE